MASSQSASSKIVLVLRLIVLFLLVAAVMVLVFNTVTVTLDLRTFVITFPPAKLTFKDLITFKYMLSVAVIAAAYTIFQLPLAIYHVVEGKRLMSGAPEFDFYADQVMSYLLATAVGAGFLVCGELKINLTKMINSLEETITEGLEDSRKNYDKFVNYGFIASALVCLAFVCMAVVSALSSVNRSKNERKSIFG
ncbi:CASP-like protein 4D1 [Linum grandiflorum]